MAHKKRKYRYSKNQFKKQVCTKCTMHLYGCNRTFCYDVLHVRNPSKFISVVTPKLLHNNTLLETLPTIAITSSNETNYATNIFKRIFCSSDICKTCDKSTRNVLNCLSKFNTQFFHNYKTNKLGRKQSRKKVIHRQNPIPKAAVLISDNKEFKMEVKRIIEYNNK